jgi:hypothetical protein
MRWSRHSPRAWKPGLLLPVATGLLCLPVALGAYIGISPHRTSPSSKTAVSAADTNLLINAEQVLIRKCMQRQGFVYWSLSAQQAYPAVRFPYVITSVSWARRHGFSDNLEFPVSADPNQRYYSKLSNSQQAAYSNALVGRPNAPAVTTPLPSGGILGHSNDGCQAAADAELYGSYQAWFKASSVVLDLPTLWQSMVLSSRQYISAVSVWSGCMRQRGYRYASPADASAAFRNSTSPQSQLTAIRAAVAEALCADSTGLTRVATHLNQQFAAQVTRKFHSSLNAEWRLERRALPRARRVLRS